MSELCRELGIPRRTFQRWVEKDPSIAVWSLEGRGGGGWWIKLDKLEKRLGSLLEAYLLGTKRWVKATTLADESGIPRRTLVRWCRDRPGFGKRIGHMYYVDLQEFGASPEQIEALLGRLSQKAPKGR